MNFQAVEITAHQITRLRPNETTPLWPLATNIAVGHERGYLPVRSTLVQLVQCHSFIHRVRPA